MPKKWYEYFVSVEGQEGGPPQPLSDPSSGPPAPKSAADEIAALAATITTAPPPKFEKPAPGAAPLSMAEIYAMAELKTPPHGYTVLKVADMLQSEHIRSLPAEVKRSSILLALDAAGVKLAEIIQDGISRDKALDAFERVQQSAVEQLEAKKIEENRALQAEIDRLVSEQKAKIQQNLEEVNRQKDAFNAWRGKKQQEEQKIADCVSHFVAENPITTGGRPASISVPPGKSTPK